jgi:hypothetical protein
LKCEVALKSEPADPDLSSIPMKQVSNRTVGKRKRKLTGCSALLQTIVKSADYSCFVEVVFVNRPTLGSENFMNSYRR